MRATRWGPDGSRADAGECPALDEPGAAASWSGPALPRQEPLDILVTALATGVFSVRPGDAAALLSAEHKAFVRRLIETVSAEHALFRRDCWVLARVADQRERFGPR